MGSSSSEVFGPVVIAFILLNGSSCFGLLLNGLFVFNLSDGVPLASPLLFVVDLCVQLFLAMLQLVCGSMFWKLRLTQLEPPLLAGVQRAGVVIMLLQMVVFAMFGTASELVLFRWGYQATLALFTASLSWLCYSIWMTDLLTDRGTMLTVALKFDFAALLVVCAYGSLHLHQYLDALASGSEGFARVVAANQWLLAMTGICIVLLLYVAYLWASISGNTARGRRNPLQTASLERLRRWNCICAAAGLFGAPVVVPCLVVHVLIGSTIGDGEMLQTAGEPRADIFFPTKGDRFDLEY